MKFVNWFGNTFNKIVQLTDMDKNENLTPTEKYYVERYHFIYGEINRLQNDMNTLEEATAKLLRELEELRKKEQYRQTEKDGEIE